MRRFHFAVFGGAILALALLSRASVGQPQAPAKSAADQQPQTYTDPLSALTAQLGLDKQQQQQIRKIAAEYRNKVEPVRKQLLQLRHDEYEAVQALLTELQRSQLPQVLQGVWDREWQTIGSKLKLSDKQQQNIRQIREEFAKKFHDMQKAQGELPEKARKLKAEFFNAVGAELDSQQRAKLPAMLHEEFGQWEKPKFRQQHLKALGDRLNVTDEQRRRIEKVHAEYAPKVQPLVRQLERLHEEEFDAIDKVLRAEQRTQLRQMLGDPVPESP